MKKFIDESWLVLVMGIVFACLLAGTQTSLKDKIAANEKEALNQAINEVVPEVKNTQKLTVDGNEVYKCTAEDGHVTGWAVKAEGAGFIDKITVVVGLTPSGDKITGIKAIKHSETPGLGNKIDSKGKNFYPKQYTDKPTAQPLALVKREPTEDFEIQAITGATYSSQYVMDIVNDVIIRIRPQLDQAAEAAPSAEASE